MMKRDSALEILARHYPDGIAVAVFQNAFDWMEIRPHPLNYVCTGAMGQASSHALGLAIGIPHEKVLVLDGDGSLLMNLGSLVTIGSAAPKNLIHFVCHNGIYEVNGEFPIPGGRSLRFDAIARDSGYRNSYSFDELSQFEDHVQTVLSIEGPTFVSLLVEKGKPYPRDYKFIHSAESRAAFRNALQLRMAQDQPIPA